MSAINKSKEVDGGAGHLLVVDDDALITATIASNLRCAGYLVSTTTSPAQALIQCKTTRFNLAIVDQRMPEMSGTELARLLLQEHGLYSLFLSAYGDSELVNAAAAAGAISYILKPIDPASLRPAIYTALRRIDEIHVLQQRETQLRQALTAEREINTAIGIVMARSKTTCEDAFEMLRRYARAKRIQMAAVARELLEPINAEHRILGEITQLSAGSSLRTAICTPNKSND
jgi:response regulator NasT